MKPLLSIEPEEASARGLPALWLSLDLGVLSLVPRKFPDEDTYLELSDPLRPGIGLSIHPLPATAPNARGLGDWVTWRWRFDPTLRLGPTGELGFKGAARPWVVFFGRGRRHAAGHCALALAHPGIILLLHLDGSLSGFGSGPQELRRTPAEELVRVIVRHPELAQALLSLEWKGNDGEKPELWPHGATSSA